MSSPPPFRPRWTEKASELGSRALGIVRRGLVVDVETCESGQEETEAIESLPKRQQPSDEQSHSIQSIESLSKGSDQSFDSKQSKLSKGHWTSKAMPRDQEDDQFSTASDRSIHTLVTSPADRLDVVLSELMSAEELSQRHEAHGLSPTTSDQQQNLGEEDRIATVLTVPLDSSSKHAVVETDETDTRTTVMSKSGKTSMRLPSLSPTNTNSPDKPFLVSVDQADLPLAGGLQSSGNTEWNDGSSLDGQGPFIRRMKTVKLPPHESFWTRMAGRANHYTMHAQNENQTSEDFHSRKDVYYDYYEGRREVVLPAASDRGSSCTDHAQFTGINIPSLRECVRILHNDEANAHDTKSTQPHIRFSDVVLNICAAFYIYLTNTAGMETLLVVVNAVLVTLFFISNADNYATKLDFSFLAFAVIFPLSFLIQQTFSRRDIAVMRLADFRACVLSTALASFSYDWPAVDSDAEHQNGGRLALPPKFNKNVLTDLQLLLQLVYEYLSMPSVSHARHLVFKHKQLQTRRVHSLQNDIVKRLNDTFFDFYQHAEEMKKYGFPSGEASRLHQFHQYLQQRWEALRYLKYYRTPQATRSFGRAYIFIMPWLAGPYYAWVYQTTNMAFALVLAGFTFLILLGLLNTQQGLEDPFLPDVTSWTPGMDTVKLEYEIAVALQAVEQFYAQAELLRKSQLRARKNLVLNKKLRCISKIRSLRVESLGNDGKEEESVLVEETGKNKFEGMPIDSASITLPSP